MNKTKLVIIGILCVLGLGLGQFYTSQNVVQHPTVSVGEMPFLFAPKFHSFLCYNEVMEGGDLPC